MTSSSVLFSRADAASYHLVLGPPADPAALAALDERVRSRFGRSLPEGYRAILSLMDGFAIVRADDGCELPTTLDSEMDDLFFPVTMLDREMEIMQDNEESSLAPPNLFAFFASSATRT